MKRQAFLTQVDYPGGQELAVVTKGRRKPSSDLIMTASQAKALSEKNNTNLTNAEHKAALNRCWKAIRKSVKSGESYVNLEYQIINPYMDEHDRVEKANEDFSLCKSNLEPLGYRFVMSGIFFKSLVRVEW